MLIFFETLMKNRSVYIFFLLTSDTILYIKITFLKYRKQMQVLKKPFIYIMYLKECVYSNADQYRTNPIVAYLIVINLQMKPIYHIWLFWRSEKGFEVIKEVVSLIWLTYLVLNIFQSIMNKNKDRTIHLNFNRSVCLIFFQQVTSKF